MNFHDILILLRDETEQEEYIRKKAREVLTEYEVYGDSYGVPPLEEIIDLLIERIKCDD